MSGDKKPKKRLRRLVGIAFSVASLAVLTYVAITLISGRSLDISKITGLFSPRVAVEAAGELHFDVGRDRVFADLGDAVAAAGSLGIQVLDLGGNEALKEAFRMSRPALSEENGRAVAFDIGGTAVRVFNGKQVIASVEASGAIVSASINRNGWFCVSAQEGGGQRGVATVYDDRGSAVYRVNLASGYALSAVLSPDNKSLAVLNLTDGGSRITIYQGLNKQESDSAFTLNGGLIIDMRYLPNGNLLAFTADSLVAIDKNGASSIFYEFFDKRLGGYAYDDGTVALHLLDYGVGFSGRLVTLNEKGSIVGELVTNRELVSISFGDGFLAVLRSDGLMFYDTLFQEFPPRGNHVPTAGATSVLSLKGGAALVAGENSAIVIST